MLNFLYHRISITTNQEKSLLEKIIPSHPQKKLSHLEQDEQQLLPGTPVHLYIHYHKPDQNIIVRLGISNPYIIVTGCLSVP